MFVWSIRASTLKFFMAVAASAMILCLLVIMVPTGGNAMSSTPAGAKTEINYEAKTMEERIKFLQDFGWQVDAASESARSVTVPNEFNRVFAGYNEIQRAQGMDLSAYKGKTVESYTYTVTNYEGYSGKVLATVLVYRGVVIGGDICSQASDGFVVGFTKK